MVVTRRRMLAAALWFRPGQQRAAGASGLLTGALRRQQGEGTGGKGEGKQVLCGERVVCRHGGRGGEGVRGLGKRVEEGGSGVRLEGWGEGQG